MTASDLEDDLFSSMSKLMRDTKKGQVGTNYPKEPKGEFRRDTISYTMGLSGVQKLE